MISFELRNRVFGKLKLRAGLPLAEPDAQELLVYEKFLTRAFSARTFCARQVWDIGCRNWSYIEALTQFFPDADLLGVELDGGRRFWNLHRRRDYARAFASTVRSRGRTADYLDGDFREFRNADSQAVFCFFFPFVSTGPCESWGLPADFSDYGALVDHALEISASPLILSVHQGAWEAEIARSIYTDRAISYRESVIRASEFVGLWPMPHDVHLFLCGGIA